MQATWKLWLGRLLGLGGWLLLAPALAALVWTLLQTLAPLPVQKEAVEVVPNPAPLLWISKLQDYWQPPESAEVAPPPRPVEPSRLRVTVQGVFIASQPQRSLVLLNYRGQTQTLAVGEALAPAITLVAIHPGALVFNRNGQLEQIDWALSEDKEQPLLARPPSAASDATVQREAQSEVQQEIQRKRVGTRALEATFGPDFRASLVADPLQLMRYLTLSPYNEGGQLQGFTLRPGADPSLFNRLGLQAGDRVIAVEGQSVGDTAAMMQLHRRLASAQVLEVEILRDNERLLFSLEME